MRATVRANDISLTGVRAIELGGTQRGLLDQLAAAQMPHTVIELPQLIGAEGCAYTVSYQRRDGAWLTVLVVPDNPGGDSPGEQWYEFAGMSAEANRERGEPWWIEQVYDRRDEYADWSRDPE